MSLLQCLLWNFVLGVLSVLMLVVAHLPLWLIFVFGAYNLAGYFEAELPRWRNRE